MSDRLLISAGTVPMLCGVVALVLLQRVAPARISAKPSTERHAVSGDPVAAAPRQWVGVVVAEYTAELAADAEGRVAEVFARTGSKVKAGDRLLQFDGKEVTTAFGMVNAELEQRRSELARAEARSEAAKSKLGRLRQGETWLSEQELDSATSEAAIAEAELRSARAAIGVGRARVDAQRLRVARRTLIAPFAGTVVGLDVDPGDSVVAGQVVMRVLSEDRQIRFACPQGALNPRGSERVSVKLGGTALTVDAHIASVRPELDPSAQLVFATAALPADLPEPSRWIPGASVQVSLAPVK